MRKIPSIIHIVSATLACMTVHFFLPNGCARLFESAKAPTQTEPSHHLSGGNDYASDQRGSAVNPGLRAKIFGILSNPDPIDRMLNFCRLIKGLGKEQCEEVRAAFLLQQQREGRIRDREQLILAKYLARTAPDGNAKESALSVAAANDPATTLTEILALRDEFEKMLLFCEFLPQVNASNWRNILAAASEAKVPPGEGFLARHQMGYLLSHIGRVAGRDAVEALVRENINQGSDALEGWAAADATSALRWYEQLPHGQQPRLIGSLMIGVTYSDPLRAANLVGTARSAQDWSFLAYTVIDTTIGVWGFRTADEAYETLKNNQHAPVGATDLAFRTLAQMRAIMSIGAEPSEAKRMLEWLEPHLPSGLTGAYDVISFAGRLDPSHTLSWAASHAHMMDAQLSKRFHTGLAKTWNKNAPGAFAAWMAEHSNEPAAVLMAEALKEPTNR